MWDVYLVENKDFSVNDTLHIQYAQILCTKNATQTLIYTHYTLHNSYIYYIRTCTYSSICSHKINRKCVLYSRHQSMYVSQSISNFLSFEMKSSWYLRAESGKKIWITYWSVTVTSHLQFLGFSPYSQPQAPKEKFENIDKNLVVSSQ